MKRLLNFILYLFFVVGFPKNICGQELPPIQIFTPKQSALGNQNWMISQGKEGTIFFANNKGLASFNGEQWVRYPTLDNSIMRSVQVIGDLIFTGNYMDLATGNATLKDS